MLSQQPNLSDQPKAVVGDKLYSGRLLNDPDPSDFAESVNAAYGGTDGITVESKPPVQFEDLTQEEFDALAEGTDSPDDTVDTISIDVAGAIEDLLDSGVDLETPGIAKDIAQLLTVKTGRKVTPTEVKDYGVRDSIALLQRNDEVDEQEFLIA